MPTVGELWLERVNTDELELWAYRGGNGTVSTGKPEDYNFDFSQGTSTPPANPSDGQIVAGYFGKNVGGFIELDIPVGLAAYRGDVSKWNYFWLENQDWNNPNSVKPSGEIRVNTTIDRVEIYWGGAWRAI